MSKQEIVKAIESRLEMLIETRDALEKEKLLIGVRHTEIRMDELETLLEYIENPRIK